VPAQAGLWGHWVHERHLPLWLVRSFEERLRREAAMQARDSLAEQPAAWSMQVGCAREHVATDGVHTYE
jgi:hypothetical protein